MPQPNFTQSGEHLKCFKKNHAAHVNITKIIAWNPHRNKERHIEKDHMSWIGKLKQTWNKHIQIKYTLQSNSETKFVKLSLGQFNQLS